jgi:hypothetical protein
MVPRRASLEHRAAMNERDNPEAPPAHLAAREPKRASTSWVAPSLGLLLLCSTALTSCASNAASPSKTRAESKDDKPADEAVFDDAGPTQAGSNRARALVGDGTLDSVTLTRIYRAPTDLFCSLSGCRPGFAVDLDFNPVRPGEMWVVFRQAYSGEPCERDGSTAGCELLESKVAVITAADGAAPSTVLKQDGNAWHFMRLATSLAFADDDTFATVGEARTGNFTNEALDYMGPSWWSSDPAIFAMDFMLNGSHLDMLHATPYGMGIAHDPTLVSAGGVSATEPVFWAFNGQSGAIDRYDFNSPHEPGGEDHSDGELARYVTGELKMVPQVPSHLEFADRSLANPDGAGGSPQWWLYIVDSGHQRVVRLDPRSGQAAAAPLVNDDGQILDPKLIEDAELVEVVPPGLLTLPSGIAVLDDLFLVSDAATSEVFAFDLDGNVLGKLDTGLPEGSLAGITVGPDRRLYFVDWNEAEVVRVEPR